jgi:integrase/recombinase XerC
MSTDLATVSHAKLPAIASDADVLTAWLSGRSPRTVAAYRFDASDFARFIKAPGPAAAIEVLLSGGPALANRLALAYKAEMMDVRKLSSATVARRLAALRSLVKLARQLGRVTWSIDIESPRVTPYRDTRGPGLAGWQRIDAKAGERAKGDRDGRAAKRNLALVRLLHDLGLRRGEAVAMDRADVDFDAGENGEGQIRIVGKGKREPEVLSLTSEPAREALLAWVEARGDEPGPLFCRLDRAANGEHLQRLTGDAVCRMVRRVSRLARLKKEARPHGLRHQAITRALDLTNGNAREVRKFSRHAKLETVIRYDDNREDVAGDIQRKLGRDR